MRQITILLFLIELFVGDAVATDAIIWQGFNHEWKRKLVGFETPHRMGSIENQIFGDHHNPKARFTFTPGVNGDFAQPEASFQKVAIADPTNFNITDLSLQFEGSDQINATDEHANHPEANITVHYKKEIPNDGHFDQAQVVLNGFEVDMKCEGSTCNSNGVWPFNFDIELHVEKHDQNTTTVGATLVLNRGWTPSHGGGKALNDVMHYLVNVPYKIIYFNKDYAQAHVRSMAMYNNITKSDPIQLREDIPRNGFDATKAIVGVQRFGFQLLANEKESNRGRYLEQIQFQVTGIKYDAESDTFSFDYENAVRSPGLTTYASQVKLENRHVVILLSDKLNPTVGSTQKVHGQVCVDDWTTMFWCSTKGLHAQTRDVVFIDEQLAEAQDDGEQVMFLQQ